VLLLAAFTIAGIVFVFRHKKRKRDEKLFLIRERIARDLHNEVSSALANVSIMSELANVSPDASFASDCIRKISYESIEMMQAMDDMVWLIKPGNDNLGRLGGRMREYLVQSLGESHVHCSFDVPEAVVPVRINMEHRKNILLIFRAAVDNIKAHASAKAVQVCMDCSAKMIYIDIMDDGIGMAAHMIDRGNGINTIHRLVDEMHGTLHISSGRPSGTRIALWIPQIKK